MPVSDPDVSRPRLIRDGSFLENDWREIAQRRRAHNRLGFAYQVAFVRVLGRFPQQEPLEIEGEILRFAALQLGADPGRALKTEFLLQYMSEPQLRAKVRRGLLKVEQLHALARAVYYGQRGRISAREVYGQMNACSCLTLILVCIVYWQTREISRIAAAPNFPFTLSSSPASARSSGRTSSSTARSRSTPTSYESGVVRVHFCTNLVRTLLHRLRQDLLPNHGPAGFVRPRVDLQNILHASHERRPAQRRDLPGQATIV